LLALKNVRPLLGEVEPRLENKGIVDPGVEPVLGVVM
jgi:hypothetical protein